MEKKCGCNICGAEMAPSWSKDPEDKSAGICKTCETEWCLQASPEDFNPKQGDTEGYSIEANLDTKQPCQELKKNTCADSTISSSKSQNDRSGTVGKNSGLLPPNVHIPRRKRSRHDPVRALHRQLLDILAQPGFEHLREEPEMLIYNDNATSSREIGLGCELLKSPDAERKPKKRC